MIMENDDFVMQNTGEKEDVGYAETLEFDINNGGVNETNYNENFLEVKSSKDDVLADKNDTFMVNNENSGSADNVLFSFGEEFGKVKYLETERKLNIPEFNADAVNEDEPFSSFKMAGKWLREALDVRNYIKASERLGEDVAFYKWAYDEGKMGEFDFVDFSKEMAKSGVRSLGADTLRMAGNIMSMFGTNVENSFGIKQDKKSVITEKVLPNVGRVFKDIGGSFKQYAEDVENLEILAPSDEVFDEDPSFLRLANVIGSGASQVLAMGGLAKLIGTRATYGLYAIGGAGEVFEESYDKDNDIGKANVLAATNAGVSFALDKIINPLPKTVEKNVKVTSRMIAEEMVGAPLREAGTEVLQQMLAENLVRKVGIDDAQDLFEGLIEAAIGSFAGSSMLVGIDGATYYSKKAYEDVYERLLLKGISADEIELAKENMLEFMAQKPEAFDKILAYNLKKNLKEMDKNARMIKNRSERKKETENVKKFNDIYSEMKNRFNTVLGDDKKASVAARLFEANAMSMYQNDAQYSPDKLLNGLLPAVSRESFEDFSRFSSQDASVSYQFIGTRAKKANVEKLSEAMSLLKNNVDPQTVWQKTGWHIGKDGIPRAEISDKDARIKIWKESCYEKETAKYLRDTINKLEESVLFRSAILNDTANDKYTEYYKAFNNYLEKNPPKITWSEKHYNPFSFAFLNLDILSEEVKRQRKAQEDYLKKLFIEGKKYKEPSKEDMDTMRAILSKKDKDTFFKFFWNPKTEKVNSKYMEFVEEMRVKHRDNPRYVKAINNLKGDILDKYARRYMVLDGNKFPRHHNLFVDLNKEKAYRRYRILDGAFYDSIIDSEYRPEAYKNAYKPYSIGEKFMMQKKYGYLSSEERRAISDDLNKIEELYRLKRHIDYIKASEKDIIRSGSEEIKKQKYMPYWYKKARARLQERFLITNGSEMKLGDILDHKELYDNYPELKNTKVSFSSLLDDAPYHFYFNKGKGYVLEIDPSQLDFANLKDVLLKGTAFAIQDIEGFDYSLPENEKKNFMDRQIHLAKKKVAPFIVAQMRKFLWRYFVAEEFDTNKYKYVKFVSAPLSLIGLTSSAKTGQERKVHEVVRYYEPNFTKLEKFIKMRLQNIKDNRDKFVRDQIYQEFQKLKVDYSRLVLAHARNNSGIKWLGLPWGGSVSQGTIDEHALIKRMDYDDEQRRSAYWEYQDSDFSKKKTIYKQDVFDDDSEKQSSADVMNVFDEFTDQTVSDREYTRNTLDNMASGAYSEIDKTIHLFETGDLRTIIHETFHYFWDLMYNEGAYSNSNVMAFKDDMEKIRLRFFSDYEVREENGKYYAVSKKDGEIMSNMPRYFEDKNELIEAAVKEIFVDKFVALIEGKFYKDRFIYPETGNFYRRWLQTVTSLMDIVFKKSSKSGRKVLKFIRKKVK